MEKYQDYCISVEGKNALFFEWHFIDEFIYTGFQKFFVHQ